MAPWRFHLTFLKGYRLLSVALVTTVVSLAGASDEGGVPSGRTSGGRDVRTTGLTDHFGLAMATRLLRSPDAADRLRGIDRARDLGSPEAVSLLIRTAAPRSDPMEPRTPVDGAARTDPRAVLAVVRALADFVDQAPARAALESIVLARAQSFALRAFGSATQDREVDDQQAAARIALARQEAALALARSAYPSAQQALLAMGRLAGPGQVAALDALAVEPPREVLLRELSSLTPDMVRLLGRIGDLRALTSIERALKSGDGAMRAAALSTLAALGDTRALAPARAGRDDPDVNVRLAAAEVLVGLSDPEAARAVVDLIGRDDVVMRALELAREVQGDVVARALVGRASATERPEVREAAVGALGRQVGSLAVSALAELVANADLEGVSLCALARSPSPAAMGAIETLAARAGTRRNAVRAYITRRSVRDERSPLLDSVAASLAHSNDARDRAVGIQALVAFGTRSLSEAFGDPDPRVRRAAALGSLGSLAGASARVLLERRPFEPDPATRELLLNGLVRADLATLVSTQTLVDVVRGGRADAILAVAALVRRLDARGLAQVAVLDEASDPVIRAQVARALGESRSGDAVGRLVGAYPFESDARVRRAIVRSLVLRTGGSPVAEATKLLASAARLDPDASVRAFARSGVVDTASVESPGREVACLRAVPREGSTRLGDLTATLVDAEDSAVAFAFDDDGYALVSGLAAGKVLVRLAPALGPYDADSP